MGDWTKSQDWKKINDTLKNLYKETNQKYELLQKYFKEKSKKQDDVLSKLENHHHWL